MIDALHVYARRCRFQANVGKCVVVVFGDPELPAPLWRWGEQVAPVEASYVYVGVRFANTCLWDIHALETAATSRAKLDKLKHVLRNKHLSVAVKRTLLMSVLKPTLAYASEVWELSSDAAKQLETVFLQVCKTILQTGERVSAKHVRADLGLLPLKTYRIISQFKFRHRVERMSAFRLPRVAATHAWLTTKRGRQTLLWWQFTGKLYRKTLPENFTGK
jgi:hypothetical protein